MSIKDRTRITPASDSDHAGSLEASVIVCAYTLRRSDKLRRAVDSALSQSVPAREVIVVIDNNAELLEGAQRWFADCPRVRVLDNRHGRGAAGARNTGAEVASGAILVFLDDDAFASEDWLHEHLATFTGPEVLGVGGEVQPSWETRAPAWLPREFFWVIGCTWTGMPSEPAPVRNAILANMSVRADVFHAVGGFQQELGRRDDGGGAITGTAEETELCIRTCSRYPGGVWMWQPGARVRHAVPGSRCTWRYFVDRCRLEGASKAVLVRHAGRQQGLASERRYVRVVLPLGIGRELAAGLRGDVDGLRRAATIAAGLLVTAATYGRARIALASGSGNRYVS